VPSTRWGARGTTGEEARASAAGALAACAVVGGGRLVPAFDPAASVEIGADADMVNADLFNQIIYVINKVFDIDIRCAFFQTLID